MTPEERDAWHALIEGAAAGRQIQFRTLDGVWLDYEGIMFAVNPDRYRLKPVEPRSVEAYISGAVFDDPRSTFCLHVAPKPNRVRVRITEIL